MSDRISNNINLLGASLSWIKAHRPEQYEQKFMQLVPRRCELRNIEEANLENPAIAAYGESQKGKSYLMGNLLQNNGAPYMVKSNGKEYDFVHSINPIGDKNEATGVVTRFTSYNRNPKLYSDEYPVRMKVLSVGSLTTILIDGYFNDIIDREIYSDEELKNKAEAIYNKYRDRQDIQEVIVEDDIFDIKSYLTKFITANAQSIWKSNFFEKVALVIRKVPQSEWIDIFSVIWHNNQEISSLFSRLINTLSRLNFAKSIYLPIEAVLHHGANKNTIMSVNCLNGLYQKDAEILYTDVYVRNASGSMARIDRFDKSEISALCCEVAFKVDSEYLDENAQFFFDPSKDGEPGYMSRRTFDKLNGSVSKKALFDNSDLLDFPGAKNRESLKQAYLANFDPETQQANMVKLFLRGKVSYLFNHYSDARLINILLVCHDAEDVKVTTLYDTIDKWVGAYVGGDFQKRKATIELTGGIAPLFVIGTKFNIDMTQKSNADANNKAALEQRWQARFSTQLYQNCFHAGDVDWFRNWVGEKRMFNNTYILRDYKYSTCDGEGNNLFHGYKVGEEAPREKSLALPSEYYRTLMDSFIENDKHVGRFFEDRALAWEVAATINNDGALYIIQQLVKVSSNLAILRNKQFDETIAAVNACVLKVMNGYYIDPNTSTVLPQRINKARGAHRELDFACNADNYFFGSLVNALQLDYKEVYEEVHKIIQSPELVEKTQGWDQFEIIRKHLLTCETEEDSWKTLIKLYGFTDKEDAISFLQKRNINPNDIIPGVKLKKKINSYIIAERVFDYWVKKLSSTAFLNSLISVDGFDSGVMIDLLRNTLEVAEGFNLCDVMSSSIAEYVNVPAVHTANEYLVADVLANIINEFVTTFGYALRTEDDIDNCKTIVREYGLPVFKHIGVERKSYYDEGELTALFVDLNENPNVLTPAFDMNYNLWLEYMYISFIGGSDRVPKIDDIAANNEVAEIIEQISTI